MTTDPFTDGDASVAIHADTCGTSTTHPGHCRLDCECWCHYPTLVIRTRHRETTR